MLFAAIVLLGLGTTALFVLYAIAAAPIVIALALLPLFALTS